ncbi:MAG: hypothetical protein AAFV53_29165 [Myxococcota bacterium]
MALEEMRTHRRDRRRTLLFTVLLLTALMGCFYVPWDQVSAVVRGERTVRGEPRYVPRHPILVSMIDLEDVHARRMTAWSLAAARPQDALNRRREAAAWARVLEGIAPDQNLVDLGEALRADVRLDPWGRAEAIQYRLWAWNRYLDLADQPWRLEADIRDGGDGAYMVLRTYRVVADASVNAGDAPRRVRLLRRADRTNVVEYYLGHAGSGGGEGALLLADRLETFTLDALWPLLDPSADERRTSVDRAWAPAVRAEINAALPARDVAALRESAARRFQAMQALDSIQSRSSCMNFRIWRLPWDGLPSRFREALPQLVARDAALPCPSVTAEEAAVLLSIRAEPGVESALEKLLAIATQITALHEARHLADREIPPTCADCVVDTKGMVDELSAYLATFSSDTVGNIAFYQACRGARGGGAHATAVALASRAILPGGCANPPPPDLAERAQQAQQQLLNRSSAPALLPGFPQKVALSD